MKKEYGVFRRYKTIYMDNFETELISSSWKTEFEAEEFLKFHISENKPHSATQELWFILPIYLQDS